MYAKALSCVYLFGFYRKTFYAAGESTGDLVFVLFAFIRNCDLLFDSYLLA